jgi:ferritin
VEEEKTAREWVARFRLVGDDPGSLLDLDRELGLRATPPAAAAGAQK